MRKFEKIISELRRENRQQRLVINDLVEHNNDLIEHNKNMTRSNDKLVKTNAKLQC